MSLHDNKFLRYFQGHTHRVTGLSTCPINDRFISTSLDKTVRVWDLRSTNSFGVMRLQEPGLASIDPEGLVFAVLMQNQDNTSIKLYDLRSFEKGPFSTFRLPMEPTTGEQYANLKFSPNGKQMMLTKIGDPEIRILDAFKGTPLHQLAGHQLTKRSLSLEASYTPDSQYIISGSENGRVHVWNAENGNPVIYFNDYLC